MNDKALQTWYANAQRIALEQYDDHTSRFAALTLIEYSYDIKRRLEPMYSEAKAWFRDYDKPGMSLEMVCELLYMNVRDVQRRCKLMDDSLSESEGRRAA